VKLREITGKMVKEIAFVQAHVNEDEALQLIQAILQARRIVVYGAGRMGLMSRAFTMRLMQLGFNAFVLGETTTPSVGPQDLLILCSGSGETRTVLEVAKMGKTRGACVSAVTCHPQGSLARLADIVVTLPEGIPADPAALPAAKPLKTTSEQNLLILLDGIAMLIMEQTGQTAEDIWTRHNNLE
jgi:6-phospho-3-hexuloisomerase